MLAILKLYGRLAAKALPRALRGWPVALLPLVYPFVLAFISGLLAPAGILGGLIGAVISAFLISSYLHLLSEVVAGTRVTWADLRRSFFVLYGPVMSVMFALWILSMLLGVMTAGMPREQSRTLLVLVGLAMVVFLNALPEVFYQRRAVGWSGYFGEATRFILAHWPAWLLPNLVLAALFLAPAGLWTGPAGARVLSLGAVFAPGGMAGVLMAMPLWLKPLMLLYVHVVMIWRGLLFDELSSGISARQRAIRDAWGR